jgi:decaprenyl-phosphate phosphoribosyltransferase
VPALTALLSTCLIAPANYVINEWLDAAYDRHHPKKSTRPSVTGQIQARDVFLEYVLLIAGGLFLASQLLFPQKFRLPRSGAQNNSLTDIR